MKKYCAAVLGVLLVLGFAASAFAIHAEIPSETQAVVAKGGTQITVGGDIRFRGEYRKNVNTFNSDAADNGANYDTRVRLSVEAKVTPNTIGKITLESGTDNTDLDTWGCTTCDAKGTYQQGNSKAGGVTILEAWIQHSGSGLLGVPALVKVGHMPIKVGNGLWLDHSKFGDDAILFGVDPMKNMHFILGTVKFSERENTLNDDANAYVLLFNYEFDKNSAVGADVTYVDDQKWTIPFLSPATADVHLWNIGANLKWDIGTEYGLVLRADGAIQFGSVENIANSTQPDQDFKGWAIVGGLDAKLGDFRLTLEGAYGSGDDKPPCTPLNQNNCDEDFDTFVTTQSNVQHFTYVYDYRTKNAAGNFQGGLQNTWYGKLGASYDISKEMNIMGAVYYLSAVEDAAIDITGGRTDGKDKDIGWEIDLKWTWKLDKNLTYWVEGGYLFAGDFWQYNNGKSPDDPYAIRHGLQLSF